MKRLTLNNEMIRAFGLFTGLSDEAAADWHTLLADTAAGLDRRIRNRDRLESDRDRLSYAAAALAFYRYRQLTDVRDGGLTVKAGEVSTRREGGGQLAAAVREEALASISDLLDDEDFYFRQI